MAVPERKSGRRGERAWRRTALAGLLLGGAVIAAHAGAPRTPSPVVKLKLQDLGFPGVPQSFLDAGASMLSVHFVDAAHLLVTFSLRGLVERLPGDPPEDDDRAVAALLVELPSGKVLARTRWHLHDHGQYLWPLGEGRFLLRTGMTMTAFAPLAGLPSGEPFRQVPFMRSPGHLDLLSVSPDGELVTLESSKPRKQPGPGGVAAVGAPATPERRVETFSFARVVGDGSAGRPLRAVSAGSLRSTEVGTLPLNGRGYLAAKPEGRDRWAVEFDSFDGESRALSSVDSSCAPHTQFVSPSQYLAFTCRGSNDKLMLSAFDFEPREMWEEPLGGVNAFAYFAYAPQAGRFAFSRGVSSLSITADAGAGHVPGVGGPPSANLVQEQLTSQEVRVYQTESGDLLMKLACAPVMRTGQNFDLSPDGMSVLIVKAGVVEVYRLPALTAADKKDLAEVRKYEPAVTVSQLVVLKRMVREAPATAEEIPEPETEKAVAVPVVPMAPSGAANDAGAGVTPTPVAAATTSDKSLANGDAAADAATPRKPPSLLKPGESAEDAKPPK